MKKSIADWNILVCTKNDPSDLKNAMLYADRVWWASVEIIGSAFVRRLMPEVSIDNFPLLRPNVLNEINRLGAGHIVVPVLSATPEATSKLPPEEIRSKGEQLMLEFVKNMLNAADNSSAVVTDFPVVRSKHWDAHQAATELQLSVSRLLLPDVAYLPFSDILELRDSTRDTLEPMRAEMLRLTNDLRIAVKNDPTDLETLQLEANNLISTRVEPIVREANHRVRGLIEKKRWKLAAGVAKVFGFVGASYIDNKMIVKAIQQTVTVGMEALKDVEDNVADTKMTSQFVLEAHRFIAGESIR